MIYDDLLYLYYSKCGIFHDFPLCSITRGHTYNACPFYKIFQDGKFGWYSIHLHSTKRASSLPRGPPSASRSPKGQAFTWQRSSPRPSMATWITPQNQGLHLLTLGLHINVFLALWKLEIFTASKWCSKLARQKINDWISKRSSHFWRPFRSIHTPTLKTHLGMGQYL